jgi:putative heme-binding domain-containing protein
MWAIRVSTLILSCSALLAQADIVITGDAARGQAIFEGKGNCMSCHRIKGAGARTGPDLSEVGARRPQQIQTKLINPDAEINAANRPYRVVLKNGSVINGRLLNLDTFTVQLIDDKENLRSFVKTDLREFAFVEKSPMPSYKGKLSDQEIGDIVVYLGTLKPPPGPPRGGPGGGGGGGAPVAAVPGRPAAPPAEPPH